MMSYRGLDNEDCPTERGSLSSRTPFLRLGRAKYLLRSWLCLNVKLRVQVQSLASRDVHLLIKLRASRRAYLDVIAAGPEIHGFQFSNSTILSAIDVLLCVFHVGVAFQCDR